MRLKEFVRSGHPPTLAAAFLYFDVSFMVWVLLGVLGVYVAQDFGLSAVQKGLLVAVPILGGALVRVPLGVLVDRIGPKRTGLVAQLAVLAPLMLGWLWARTWSQVLVTGLLLGIAGGSFAVALPLASRWYPPKHQGLAMGIAGAGNSGTVLAALLAPRLAERIGWHGVFGAALIPVLGVLAFFAWCAREVPARLAPAAKEPWWRLCREPDLWRLSGFYSFTFGGFVGLASFLVIFFHDQYGLNKLMAGNFTALCVCAGSCLRPVGGYLADRFGGTRMLSVFLALAAVGLFALSALPSLPAATALLFGIVACLGMGNGSVFQLVPQRFRRTIGLATGIVGAIGGLGGFALPCFLGVSRQFTGSYQAGFLCLAGFGVACLIGLRLVRARWAASWLAPQAAARAVSPAPREHCVNVPALTEGLPVR